MADTAAGSSMKIMSMSGDLLMDFDPDPSWSVSDLKRHILSRIGIGVHAQHLMVGSTLLKSSDLLIEVLPENASELLLLKATGTELTYSHDLDTNGLFYYIGTEGGQKEWSNPGVAGIVTVEYFPPACGHATDAVGRSIEDCHTGNCAGAWWSFDLGPRFWLVPNCYTIRHKCGTGCNYLRSWDLEARADISDDWITLRSHVNDVSLNGDVRWGQEPPTASWSLETDTAFTMFRLRLTDRDSSGSYHICCCGFELYGVLFES